MPTTREQSRAQHAYDRVGSAGVSDDYKVMIRSLGPMMLRGGLSASLAWAANKKNDASGPVARGLSSFGIPGLSKPGEELTFTDMLSSANELDLDRYMLATQELLALLVWFKRAVEAPTKGS